MEKKLWTICTVRDQKGAGHSNADLARDVAMWHTLLSSTADKGGNPRPNDRQDLNARVKMWATSTTRDSKDGANPSENVPTNSLLGRQAPRFLCSHPDLMSLINGAKSSGSTPPSPRLSLNPVFAAWLMGWPRIDATCYGSSATEWSRYRLRMRSALCGLLSALPPKKVEKYAEAA